MSKRLLEKAGLIGQPATTQPGVLNRSTPGAEAARAKTAPGTMLGFMSAQSAAVAEAEQLKERLRDFEGATPVRSLDPRIVGPSAWANRHAASLQDAEFDALKAEISQAGGNVQPIKVRPRPADAPAQVDGMPAPEFEIVYGHRRHRACLELELPVRALVEAVDDQRLFEQMERENRQRKNLSAWEQGCMYRRAIDAGLYASQRKLAEALGVDVAMVSKSLALARLPSAVVEAFASPLDIQYRWAQPLSEAVQKDPDGIIARAGELVTRAPRPQATVVFDVLVGRASATAPAVRETLHVRRGKARVGLVETDGSGRLLVRFDRGVISEARREALVKLLEEFLAG